MRVFDPVAGGEALLMIDVRLYVKALAVFADPATGAPRLVCGCLTTERCVSSTRSLVVKRWS